MNEFRENQFNYYRCDSTDLFKKCEQLSQAVTSYNQSHQINKAFSVPICSSLDHKIKIDLDPYTDQEILCFDSNGYLGLQHHPEVKKIAKQAIDKYGTGTPSVPLLGGMSDSMKRLEREMAQIHQQDDAMIFTSTYMANVGVIHGLIRPSDILIVDSHAHASLQDGAKLCSAKKVLKYRSDNLKDLEKKLDQTRNENPKSGILVVCDAVYSMEGRLANLPIIRKLTHMYNAKLLIDECHSIGVLGENGKGLEEYYQMQGKTDIIVGGFSKAFGGFGGYICASKSVIDYLRFFANSWIFSTSMPASFSETMLKTIEVFQKEKIHLNKLKDNTIYLKRLLRDNKIIDTEGPSAIIPIPIGDNIKLFNTAKKLLTKGVKVGIVSYPAVPRKRGILRIVVTARHTKDDLEKLVKTLKLVLPQELLQ